MFIDYKQMKSKKRTRCQLQQQQLKKVNDESPIELNADAIKLNQR